MDPKTAHICLCSARTRSDSLSKRDSKWATQRDGGSKPIWVWLRKALTLQTKKSKDPLEALTTRRQLTTFWWTVWQQLLYKIATRLVRTSYRIYCLLLKRIHCLSPGLRLATRWNSSIAIQILQRARPIIRVRCFIKDRKPRSKLRLQIIINHKHRRHKCPQTCLHRVDHLWLHPEVTLLKGMPINFWGQDSIIIPNL